MYQKAISLNKSAGNFRDLSNAHFSAASTQNANGITASIGWRKAIDDDFPDLRFRAIRLTPLVGLILFERFMRTIAKKRAEPLVKSDI